MLRREIEADPLHPPITCYLLFQSIAEFMFKEQFWLANSVRENAQGVQANAQFPQQFGCVKQQISRPR